MEEYKVVKDNFSILVVGSINLDLVLKTSRIPDAGESLIGENYLYIPGGKGNNQAVATSRLGGMVTFVGCIGIDSAGTRLRNQIKKEGINTNYLKQTSDDKTGLAVIMLEESAQNRILVYPGANMFLTKEDIDEAFSRTYDCILLQLEIPSDVVIYTCNKAKERGIPIILDAGPAQHFSLEQIKGLDILSPNETETYALTGIKVENINEAKEAALLLANRSEACNIVIKMGRKGAFLYNNGYTKMYSGYSVNAIDTTAAGDAFMAALTLMYLEKRDIDQAIKYANIVGALTVTKLGALPSLPTFLEVQEFMQEELNI
jgi:ribokinase